MRSAGECYNNCSHRGVCTPGQLCACAPGWRGYDCAVPGGVSAAHGAPHSHGRGFMYVHSPPASLGLAKARLGARKVGESIDPLYQAENSFVERLMSDWSLRTLDARRARLFYVPTWAYAVSGNTAVVKTAWHYDALLRSMRNDSVLGATWAANRSAHVFWFAGDKGACGVPRERGAGPIFVSHWGLSVPWNYMVAVPPGYDADAAGAVPPCTEPRDLVVPPNVGGAGPPRAAAEGAEGERGATATAGDLPCELFFAGTPQVTGRKSAACPNRASPGPLPQVYGHADPLVPASAKGSWQRCYSQGVREQVFLHHANRSRFCISRRAPAELYRRARFCLAPSGEGFGNRLALAMLAGCVPLIIQPNVRQPFDDLLPYDDFSLRLPPDDVPRLHELLPAVGEAEHARLRRGVARHAAAFSWGARGEAYEHVRLALCLRAGLPCRHLEPGRPRTKQRARRA